MLKTVESKACYLVILLELEPLLRNFLNQNSPIDSFTACARHTIEIEAENRNKK